jgi:hypothetical protein
MEERAARKAANATEYIWRPSRSLGTASQVFAGFNIHGYDPPALPSDPANRSPFHWDVSSRTMPSATPTFVALLTLDSRRANSRCPTATFACQPIHPQTLSR